MDPLEWADLCPQTIVHEALASRDNYGKPAYAAPVTYVGRRVFKFSRVAAYKKGEGTDAISESTIWILGLPTIGYEDRVYVSGDTVYPAVLNVTRYPDEDGDLYVKVALGSANG